MLTVALVLAFVGAVCFGALAMSLGGRPQAPTWTELREVAPEPPVLLVPRQRTVRVESVVTSTSPLHIPAQRRYAEVLALPTVREQRQVTLDI